MDHTSRAYEETKLREIIDFARRQAEETGAALTELDAHIQDMTIRYNSDNIELYSQLVVATDRQQGMRDLLGRCLRAQNSPYFGRVDFAQRDGPLRELYIGRGGLYDEEAGEPIVIDWRTPIANLYYDAELGDASYTSLGVEYPGELRLKRTYSIAGGVLSDYYDADLVTSDELLQAYLAKNADAVLKDIVATIQKDQNEIIRIQPWSDVVVQGVAGSGKTTVAMHRLAFLIFNYAADIKPEQYAIIGTNRMFLNYVAGMLPDLGVEQVQQLVMQDLLRNYLARKEPAAQLDARTAPRRASAAFFRELEAYVNQLERDLLLHPISLGGQELMGTVEISDRILGGLPKPLLKKVELLNEWLSQRVKEALPQLEARLEADCDRRLAAFRRGEVEAAGGVGEIIDGKYTALNQLRGEAKALRNIYLKRVRSLKEGRVYADFLATQGLIAPKKPDLYDLAALAYLAFRLRPMESRLRQILVDEAQDFGPMLYLCLTAIFSQATFTILGDLSQNIGDGVGLTDWDEVLDTAFSGRKHRFCVLSKSYRNTVEIAETANRVIEQAEGRVYHAAPVVRHGAPVVFTDCRDQAALISAARQELADHTGGSLAFICPGAAAARRLHEALPGAALILAGEDAMYQSGVTVFDADSVKGLEFDRVVLCGAGAADYPAKPRSIRLLYVALTRALHSLRILHISGSGGLLLADGAFPVV